MLLCISQEIDSLSGFQLMVRQDAIKVFIAAIAIMLLYCEFIIERLHVFCNTYS